MRSIYVSEQKLKELISCMNYENALAIRVSNATGLRISDVLGITYASLLRGNKITVRESKTGKSRRVYVPVRLRWELMHNSIGTYCFPHKRDKSRHRTRQAVYMEFKKACDRLNLDPAGVSPHSVRKLWAVREFDKTKSIIAVQKKLNHKYPGTTAMYAFSDKMETVPVSKPRRVGRADSKAGEAKGKETQKGAAGAKQTQQRRLAGGRPSGGKRGTSESRSQKPPSGLERPASRRPRRKVATGVIGEARDGKRSE
jgi:hypothetical protein